jgi:hypothetical protein
MKSTCPTCDNDPRTDDVDHASIASHFEREVIRLEAENEHLRVLLRDAPILFIDKGSANRRGETEMLEYAARLTEWMPLAKAAVGQ